MAAPKGNYPEFLAGGGEMGERIRNFDWSKTPLGAPETWEQSLKTCIRIMLASSQPIWIGWGKELIKFYNDPYKAIVGGKHPDALGQPASVVWSDIWKDIEHMLRTVMENDEGTYVESQLLIMERNNYPEETYYTFSYTPIPGDNGGTSGMICANTDDTSRILNERALEVLRDLGKLSYSETGINDIYQKAAAALARNPKDFPFALIYQIDEQDKVANQVAWAGSRNLYRNLPDNIDFNDPKPGTRNISLAINTGEIVLSENNYNAEAVPKGFWDIPPRELLHIPMRIANAKLPLAVLTVGLNPFRKYDNQYQQFIKLLSDQLALVLNNLHALEMERRRSEALAELDKAKTVFFNNISHEFRTPLTLILGPLEELIHNQNALAPHQLASVETTHRNAMRLLKLVNTLLDFSRIESGRVQAVFSPTPIDKLTRNLAASFRSMIEKAGLKFTVDIEDVSEPVYVDRDMWEKILFNLLSNAFKYTLSGEISVNVSTDENSCVLQVTDTGIGMPESELPNLFKRFHRIHGSAGRSYEGTGIGLSMIRELIALHRGTITAKSVEGKGSTFTVTIPLGHSHLPPDQVTSSEPLSESFADYNIEPFLLEREKSVATVEVQQNKPALLVVDDNPDMREHLSSLLQGEFNISLANDGMDAMLKINQQMPDLVISDIMMPVMDGVELLTHIKQNPKTVHIPVILLSARAGEESRIEGYDTGADDYLVKPFSARELLARVNAQLKLAKTRSHSETQIRSLFNQAPLAICIFRGPEFIVELANEMVLKIWGKKASEVLNMPVIIGLPEIEGQGFIELLQSVYTTGETFVTPEQRADLFRNGKLEEAYLKFVYEPLRDPDGTITGVMAVADEITEAVMSRKKIEESRQQLEIALTGGQMGTFDYYPKTGALQWSEKTREFFNSKPGEKLTLDSFINAMHPDDRERSRLLIEKALSSASGNYENEYRVFAKDNTIRWMQSIGRVFFDQSGEPTRFSGIAQEITERKKVEQTIRESEQRFRTLADESPLFVFIVEPGIEAKMTYFNKPWLTFTGQTFEEAVKHAWKRVVHPDDLKKMMSIYRDAYTRKVSYVIDAIRIMRYDGQYRWHSFKGNPRISEDGEFAGYIGVGIDIHERKISDEMLRESEERFRTLAHKLPQLVWVTDAAGNGEFLSARWKEYSGGNPDGKNFWNELVHPEDLEENNDAWTKSLRDGSVYRADVRLRNSKGEYRWHSVIGEPIRNDEGEIAKWVGAFSDTHDEKTFSRQLEDLVIARTNELSAKNEDLEKMNKELESFAYISSHDLQEPLRKIQTFASRIIDREFENLSQTGKQHFERMQDAAHRMQTLIEDLLAYSRTSSQEREFETVGLGDMIDEISEEFHEDFLAKNAVIEKGTMRDVEIIPFQFRQLLHNLLTNSLKFAKDGVAPVIRIDTQIISGKDTGISKLYPSSDYVMITVSDNGIGFDPTYGEKIFEVFQRLHGRDQYSGTGIGLAIVKRIVENHKGFITAMGNPGQGATFKIYLPAKH